MMKGRQKEHPTSNVQHSISNKRQERISNDEGKRKKWGLSMLCLKAMQDTVGAMFRVFP